MAAGLFERSGMKPTILNVGRVTRMEATRTMVAYLVREGYLDGLLWDLMSEEGRETWIKAVTEVYAEAARKVSKEAYAELAVYEEMALLLSCRRCGSAEEEPCRDQRVSFIRYIKHPHKERMDDMDAA